MKMNLKVLSGAESRDHLVELASEEKSAKAESGSARFIIDGEPANIDWAKISSEIYSIIIQGRSYEVRVSRPASEHSAHPRFFELTVGPRHFLVEIEDRRYQRYRSQAAGAEGPREIVAPMPGKVVKILVSENQEVAQDDGLLVIEAMKMQNELRAPRSGRVEEIFVSEGSGIQTGSKLVRLV